MGTFLRTRVTYANVVSTLALMLALSGGVAWAATSLGRNSVKSTHIATGAVTSSDIRDRTILLKDLSKEVTGSGKNGANGANGLQGPKGDQGPAGPAGAAGAPGKDATIDGRRMSEAFETVGVATTREVATVGPLTVTLSCLSSSYPYWLIRVTSSSASPSGVYGAVEGTNQSIVGYGTVAAGAPADGLIVTRGPGGNPSPYGVNWAITVVLPDGTIHDVRSLVRRTDAQGTDNDRCFFPAKALVERVSQPG